MIDCPTPTRSTVVDKLPPRTRGPELLNVSVLNILHGTSRESPEERWLFCNAGNGQHVDMQ